MTASNATPPLAKPPYNGSIDLLEEDMFDQARRITGLDDFGDTGFREGMRMMLTALGPLSDASWAATRDELVAGLVCRLRTEEGWKRNPGYRDVVIRAPLVICGIPRTGTTVLHKLLSIDPQFQGLEHWLCEWPMPRPARDEWPEHEGFRDARDKLEERHRLSPGMKLTHEVMVDELDECLEILRQDWNSNRYSCTFDVPSYDRWQREQDERSSYRRLADVMRLIGLNSHKRWLLKNPGHLAHLDALFAVFPDACVVRTTRDLVSSIASVSSVLTWSGSRFNDQADPKKIGPRELDYWSAAARHADIEQSKRPDQIYEVAHAAFHADSIGTARSIYTHFGLKLTPGTEARMRRWLAANPAGKNGEHVYDLAKFGLTEEMIRAAFEPSRRATA